MPKIVISYRRSDSEAITGRIVDRLISEFGADDVFMDVDNIPLGTDFRAHIQSVLANASVLIAVVGPNWLGTGDGARHRVHDPDDPVRVEVETAMRQKLLVIPVLVNNATMPKSDTLPESLQGFPFLNAAPIDSGRDFRAHIGRLIASIETVLPKRSGGAAVARAPSLSTATKLVIPIAAIIVLAIGGSWWLGARSSRPPTVTTPSPASTAANPSPTSAPAVNSAATPPPAPPVSADDQDWAVVRQINSYEAYQSYARRHPDGSHLADAAKAALAIALIAEPPAGQLPIGSTVLVDDRACDADHIKQLIAGDIHKSIPRVRNCVPRNNPF